MQKGIEKTAPVLIKQNIKILNFPVCLTKDENIIPGVQKTPVIEVISFPLTGILLGHPVNSDTIDGVDNRSSS